MIMLRRLALVCSLVLVLLVPMGGVTASAAPGCKPYCNDTTSRIAKRIKGKGHDAWLATTLDIGGYHGKRWAEITRIPAGHGKRNIGVIHVPKRKAKKARAALSGVYFAQRGGRFVVPLKTK